MNTGVQNISLQPLPISLNFDANRKRTMSHSFTGLGLFEANAGLLNEGRIDDKPQYSRPRRISFSLTGPTTFNGLDNLVSVASANATSAAVSREASKLGTVADYTTLHNTPQLGSSAVTPRVSPTGSRKTSFITGDSDVKSATIRNESNSAVTLDIRSNKAPPDVTVSFASAHNGSTTWYNTAIFPTNPLSSNLVKNYLASIACPSPLALENLTKRSAKSPAPYTGYPSPLSYLPDSLQVHIPLASTTIPLSQLHRARQAINETLAPSASVCARCSRSCYDLDGDLLHQSSTNRWAVPKDKWHAWTDFVASSGTSDAEYAVQSKACGYMSDGNACTAAEAEAEHIRMVGRRLDADLLRTPAPSKGRQGTRTRTFSGSSDKTGCTCNTLAQPLSTHSVFDLSHLYEGLKPASSRVAVSSASKSSDWNTSPLLGRHGMPISVSDKESPLIPTPPRSDVSSSPPGTPNSHSPFIKEPLPRLRSLLANHFGTQRSSDVADDNSYYYMDKAAMERRIQAQASNVMSPVSF